MMMRLIGKENREQLRVEKCNKDYSCDKYSWKSYRNLDLALEISGFLEYIKDF